jgi:hypothetical protein
VVVTFLDIAADLGRMLDSTARLVRRGRVEGAPLPLSASASAALAQGRSEHAVSAWFPSASPRLHTPGPGRVWLDVLQTAVTPSAHNAPYYIVYQRLDVSGLAMPPPAR